MAGIAMLRDEARGGFAVVYARGACGGRTHDVVRARVAEDDAIVGLAAVRSGPVAVEYGSDCPPPDRHARFGDPWSAVVVPILAGDRCIGALELVDTLEGRGLPAPSRDALATLAQHLADVLAGRDLHVHAAFAAAQVGLADEG
jgi:hypothetical protein